MNQNANIVVQKTLYRRIGSCCPMAWRDVIAFQIYRRDRRPSIKIIAISATNWFDLSVLVCHDPGSHFGGLGLLLTDSTPSKT